MKRVLSRSLLFAGLLWIGLSIAPFAAPSAPTASEQDDEVERLRLRLEEVMGDPALRLFGTEIATRRTLQTFYAQRGFRRAWTTPESSDALLAAVRGSRADGLDPDDYLRPALERAATAAAQPDADLAVAIDRDIVQTDALARLLDHLIFGKVTPKSFDPHWNFSRAVGPKEPAAYLEEIVASGRIAERIEAEKPDHELYLALREGLARERDLAARGEPPFVGEGPTLRPGDRGPRVDALRRRVGLGDGGDVFDDALLDAVKKWQSSRGLEADGIVGPATRAAVDLPAADRIRQIRVNLERMRWYLHDLASTFVFVNLAGYQAYYLRDGKLVWSQPAIVGKPYRATPVFRASMTYLVLNPTWTVPPTILANDLLPAQRRDHGYLDRQNIQVVDASGRVVKSAAIDWSKARPGRFPYQLVQRPGPDNALGRVKFMFPNSHAVYLHDTPARALFERSERAFSSGCIRIANPLDLAALLLADQPEWSRAAIDEAIAKGTTRTVRLSKPVPVLLTYFTAWVDREGTLQLRRDVYGRDEQVWRGLEAEFHVGP